MQDVGLYIHIPFCKMKCYYCDFPSFSGKEENMIPYAQALSKEIQNICKDKNIRSIFIGGGTPTYLSLQGWIILKEAIDKLEKQHIEFTIEGNPKTFTEEKLKLFREMGVNRISVGLQAWQEAHLKSLGRIHSLQEFKNTYDLLRAYGFTNINVDIMFGLPNQTLAQWRETLHQVISLKPEHISAYSLIIEEGTHFYNLYEKDQLILPNEEEERQMYEDAVNILKENGYNQYEISNFAKEGMECKHNLIYWSLENYVGCGSAAHSYLEGVRYRNEENIEKYICKVNNENNAIIQKHLNSKEENMEEFMFLGLRKTKGVSTLEFEKKFGEDIHKVYGKVIEKYIKLELLKEDSERIYLTPKGVELSNVVMSDFLL
ncbi:oxygen-independent coproporphyrinogen-3 oxidase [Clostridium punense]|uniref:Heme chaperone HemW n=1 Tax=Clostridium punense TaxID=1054297 RepID=A0ABS4JZ22_9CLOT|nr:radical SAM family heme chaperone HemW [Clostridium punense]MBP2020235.1 oxygen-independent coproporphyrinogen-3 oxidase [Clostridium punense]